MKTVIVFGSGLCAPPLIKYLSEKGYNVIVASRTLSKAQFITKNLSNVECIAFDITKEDCEGILDEIISRGDVIVSLLPYIYHLRLATAALERNKHFCTASFISEGLQALHQRVVSKGLQFINECGVDPGLDHMITQKMIDEVHAKGGKVLRVTSLCGGLPQPNSRTTPIGYKLSWSPRGVLLASKNEAKVWKDGKEVNIKAGGIYHPIHAHMRDFGGEADLHEMEWYYNRDSVTYLPIYQIPECLTLIRGTYRYPGWCKMMKFLSEKGFTSLDPITLSKGLTYRAFSVQVMGHPLETVECDVDVRERLIWLGLDDEVSILGPRETTALDVLSGVLDRKLGYKEDEQDMILMTIEMDICYPPHRIERIESRMVNVGLQPNGGSAMSRTVALPLAVAVEAILTEKIKEVGVLRPLSPTFYQHILSNMADHNIIFRSLLKKPLIWVRAETKAGERRVIVTPAHAKQLIAEGYEVVVERSALRCFEDSSYAEAGCRLMPPGSWVEAPYAAFIIGLKEVDPSVAFLFHRHVYFAHCFKGQVGWKDEISRYSLGSGCIYDLEFLTDENGRRVAAFGYSAGLVGAGLGILALASKRCGKQLTGPLQPFGSLEEMIKQLKAVVKRAGKVRAVVIGALGRCGRGAVHVLTSVGVEVAQWDLQETAKGGPFPELPSYDLLINCVLLQGKVAPFLTREMLLKERNLDVFVDVSCDYTNPHNPFPLYDRASTLDDPVIRIEMEKPLDIISIDHMPTLLPTEASEGFANDIYPHLVRLQHAHEDPVWSRAEELFHHKCTEAGIASS